MEALKPRVNAMQFPYGLANFEAIAEDGLYYIDRTDRIHAMEEAGRQLLLLRPRRFGKSLWLSTLENYYDLAKADRFEELFGTLKIGQNPTPLHNRYVVMKWNFSVVEVLGDANAIRRSLYNHLNSEIRAVALKYRHWLTSEVLINEDDGLASFRSLLAAIEESGRRLYLFIDEYDNFANEVLVSVQQGNKRYDDLVGGEGVIKTLFKVIKDAIEGRGLERVFITGVTPVVMADITSGYNVIRDISRKPEFDDLCGFHEEEVSETLERIADACDLSAEKRQEALAMMRTFYNGYNFSLREERGLVYNPTLALYFFDHFQGRCDYPDRMLDSNLAMDRNRIEYVGRLPHGQALVEAALEPEEPILIDELEDRFGVQMMLKTPKDHGFLASLLYYFGVLTYVGRTPQGKKALVVPNLVVRKLYAERMREELLPGYEVSREREQVCDRFYSYGELEPLAEFIERRLLPVFDNRDLRWSNELTLKTAFLTALFNDSAYIMDSETAIDKGYGDLSMIVRPDMRQYQLLDHLLEFKYIPLKELGLTSEKLAEVSREELRKLPRVQQKLAEADAQLAGYRETLEKSYGPKLKLRTHALVGIGLTRLAW